MMKRGLIAPFDDEETEKSEELLIPLRSKRIVQIESSAHDEHRPDPPKVEGTEQSIAALSTILKVKPDDVSLFNALSSIQRSDEVNIHVPSPRLALLINILVDEIVPDWWPQVASAKVKLLRQIRELLIKILRTVTGLGAILNRVKYLTSSLAISKAAKEASDPSLHLKSLIQLCEHVLDRHDTLHALYTGLEEQTLDNAKRVVAWKEALSLLASGRALSFIAAAEDAIDKAQSKELSSWIANGSMYATWLGRSIHFMLCATREQAGKDNVGMIAATAQTISKALTFSHRDKVMNTIVFGSEGSLTQFLDHPILTSGRYLQLHEMRKILVACLQRIDKDCFLQLSTHRTDPEDGKAIIATAKLVGNTSDLLCRFVAHNADPGTIYVSMLLDLATSPMGDSCELHRSLVLALDELDKDGSKEYLSMVFEKNLERFGDPLFIKHEPIIVQEATAQVILLAAAYIHRNQPMLLFTLVRSSTHMQGVSNRLSSTSKRAVWLGMVVSMALSSTVDKPDLQIKFDTPDMNTTEAVWYRGLMNIADTRGRASELQTAITTRETALTSKTARTQVSRDRTSTPGTPAVSKPESSAPELGSGLHIIEIETDSDGDDLVPYAKPDSDPEDNDEDPTLVNRNKPKPPVYIRDLIIGLNEKENYDKHHVALSTAADLINRKASFGKEVSDNAEELANIFMGLQDTFEMESFDEFRQKALTATLLASPTKVAPYIAQHFFQGEYSLQQRTVMLVSLGLGARQIAGFDERSEPKSNASFPSKQLPPHLHKIYGQLDGKSNLVDEAAARLENRIIQPMALDAADQLTGPNALKVRTFSSRMAVEKSRKKPIANALAQTVAEAFFYPLTGRWWQQARTAQSPWKSTNLLPMFLRTLALIIHASGPSATALPQMTSEFWELLFSVRNAAFTENLQPVIESILFAFMVLIDVNEDKRRLAAEQTNELLETREWARLVLERMGGANTLSLDLAANTSKHENENERIRMLAAGVIMKCNEVVEKWQRLMLGGMIEP